MAIEPDTKLVLNFTMGKRDQHATNVFIEGLRLATSNRHFRKPLRMASHLTARPSRILLEDRVDFAQLIKVYRATPEGERRYSPAEVVSTDTVIGIGQPDPERICTSHVKRQNLSMRMGIRRFTRLNECFQ